MAYFLEYCIKLPFQPYPTSYSKVCLEWSLIGRISLDMSDNSTFGYASLSCGCFCFNCTKVTKVTSFIRATWFCMLCFNNSFNWLIFPFPISHVIFFGYCSYYWCSWWFCFYWSCYSFYLYCKDRVKILPPQFLALIDVSFAVIAYMRISTCLHFLICYK